MSAFPPIRTLPSIPLPPSTALKHLQAYLAATQENPYLLPNTTLQSDGPRAHSESAVSLAIHNLKRVEAGLRGEWLAPSLDLEAGEFGDLGLGVGRAAGVEEEEAAAAEGWQDLDEYRREQSIEIGEGEVEMRGKSVEQVEDGEAMEVVVETEVEAEVLDEEARKALVREEKRRKKKEGFKKERKERHKKQSGSK